MLWSKSEASDWYFLILTLYLSDNFSISAAALRSVLDGVAGRLDENREIARQAVRESMVLLKNNNNVLPIDPSKKILVIGDGAASISKASGGWTLSWQGNNHTNDEFPNGESILSGIEEIVKNAGGEVIFSETGETSEGLMIMLQPEAKAGPILKAKFKRGKFQAK